MQRRDEIVLQKVLGVIEETEEISTDISEEKFLKNNLLKMAMTMAILRVGELVKNLSQEFRAENQQVKWKAIAGFRDIIAHNMKRLIWRKFTKQLQKIF